MTERWSEVNWQNDTIIRQATTTQLWSQQWHKPLTKDYLQSEIGWISQVSLDSAHNFKNTYLPQLPQPTWRIPLIRAYHISKMAVLHNNHWEILNNHHGGVTTRKGVHPTTQVCTTSVNYINSVWSHPSERNRICHLTRKPTAQTSPNVTSIKSSTIAKIIRRRMTSERPQHDTTHD